MEEVDNIILVSLARTGTNIPDGLTSLKALSTEVLVEGTARCINIINGNADLPTSLPGGMSARFRIGTSLATACKDLGYAQELGYNNFLYPNESDVRSLLMWLVEKLPKESSGAGNEDEVVGSNLLYRRGVASVIGRQLAAQWAPSFCLRNGMYWRNGEGEAWHVQSTGTFHHLQAWPVTVPAEVRKAANYKPSTAQKRYLDLYLDPVSAQPPLAKDIVASILDHSAQSVVQAHEWELEWNTHGLKSGLSVVDYNTQKRLKVRGKMTQQVKTALLKCETQGGSNKDDILSFLRTFAGLDRGSSRFLNQEAVLHKKSGDGGDVAAPKPATEEELQAQREAELAALQEELATVDGDFASLEEELRKLIENTPKINAKLKSQTEENQEREEAYKMRKKVLDLLPNADENIKQLQAVIDGSANRLLKLAAKWEERRTELINTYRKLREAQGQAKTESQRHLETIKAIGEEIKQAATHAKEKDVLLKQLQSDYDNLKKDISRSSYTRRIMEIVKNIQKQNQTIHQVLIDTRVIQKDINQLTEKLERTFYVTDELIFRDAKKDDVVRQSYKQLAALHDNAGALIGMVEETGRIMREHRDLEDSIEAEQRKGMDANLERIANDCKTIKKENAQLVLQIKGVE